MQEAEMTLKEATALVALYRRERDAALTETAWERYLRERPEFAARLQGHLNKIPAMVEEAEKGKTLSYQRTGV